MYLLTLTNLIFTKKQIKSVLLACSEGVWYGEFGSLPTAAQTARSAPRTPVHLRRSSPSPRQATSAGLGF